ncbi:MAG: hypothetical protein CEO19_308 [Parcubacteria group bacterium Gr01-1014_73]|nr:MAG: hypothetical protein CEO19_308 [Parcubacteria group bacterium Gr01-1014_73]
MDDREDREQRFAKVWQNFLANEGAWNASYLLQGGYIKLPPLQVVSTCFINLGYDSEVVRREAPLLFNRLRSDHYIETMSGCGRGSPLVGFRILKRDALPVTPQKVKPVKVEEIRRIVGEQSRLDTAMFVKKIDEQIPQLRALLSPRVRARPNIVVLFDTANFGKQCDKIGAKMPIGQLFGELAKIGNVIGSFAFFNYPNCPERIVRIFTGYNCAPIACHDNKNNNGAGAAEDKTDWIDQLMERFLHNFLQALDFDIAVIVSGDTHFRPLMEKVKQFGRQVMRCTVDDTVTNKGVYLWNEKGLVTTLKTERF